MGAQMLEVSIRSWNRAPSRRACVVNGQMIKASNKLVRPPPPLIRVLICQVYGERVIVNPVGINTQCNTVNNGLLTTPIKTRSRWVFPDFLSVVPVLRYGAEVIVNHVTIGYLFEAILFLPESRTGFRHFTQQRPFKRNF